MTATERLIEEIMAGSRIPVARGHREVLRELRTLAEDFVNSRRQSGRADAAIERLLAERFGDPRQIAREFAWVYRRERAALHLRRVPDSHGTSEPRHFRRGDRDADRDGLRPRRPDVACVRFRAHRNRGPGYSSNRSGICTADRSGEIFRTALALLAAVAAVLLAVFGAAGLAPQFVLFGFANSAMPRGIQVAVRHTAARPATVLACFAVLGAVFIYPSSSALVATSGSWLTMGSAYDLTTHVAVRVDNALVGRL